MAPQPRTTVREGSASFSANELRHIFGDYALQTARGRDNFTVKLDVSLGYVTFLDVSDGLPCLCLYKFANAGRAELVLMDGRDRVVIRTPSVIIALDAANRLLSV